VAGINLMESIQNKFSEKNLGGKIDDSITFSTGTDVVDIYAASRNPETGDIIPGLPYGKIFTIVGKSGTGKTTLAVQSAWNMIAPFENGGIIHLDYERSSKTPRIQKILGITEEEMNARYMHINDDNLYTETLYEQVRQIANIKRANRDALLVDYESPEGPTVRILPPTIILIDSIAAMVPKNITEEEELSGSMSASAIAKTNNGVFKRIMGDLIGANITVICINHLTTKISINPMQKVVADVNYLKADESMPGGSASIYLCDTLLKLVTKGKLDPEKEFGIRGFYAEGMFIKSRSAAAGRPFTLVYDQNYGFSNVYTNYVMLKEQKLVGGAGQGFYLDGLPNIKFSQKNFAEKLNTVPALQNRYEELLSARAEELID
jgi:RecA/RadA recombinase